MKIIILLKQCRAYYESTNKRRAMNIIKNVRPSLLRCAFCRKELEPEERPISVIISFYTSFSALYVIIIIIKKDDLFLSALVDVSNHKSIKMMVPVTLAPGITLR